LPIGCSTPQFGDIVSCCFPEDERPGLPGPKARPALVIGSRDGKGPDGKPRRYLTVAYCTSQRVDSLQENEIAVGISAGFHEPSKIVLGRRRELPLIHRYFQADWWGEIKLGALPPETLKQVMTAMTSSRQQKGSARNRLRDRAAMLARVEIVKRPARHTFPAAAAPFGQRERSSERRHHQAKEGNGAMSALRKLRVPSIQSAPPRSP
jgi:hypothetical protein